MVSFIQRPIAEGKVIDPACGDGNLLLAVIDHMERAGLTDIHDRISGMDIDEKMVQQARFRLAERLSCESKKIGIFQEDFFNLAAPSIFETPKLSLHDFNTVISNPPYGNLREFDFFRGCSELLPKGAELVFLMPLAFMDRARGVSCVPLAGRPLGVTTGHVIAYHRSGDDFELRSVKEYQQNSSEFSVLSGVKLMNVEPVFRHRQKRLFAKKPYSSSEPNPDGSPVYEQETYIRINMEPDGSMSGMVNT